VAVVSEPAELAEARSPEAIQKVVMYDDFLTIKWYICFVLHIRNVRMGNMNSHEIDSLVQNALRDRIFRMEDNLNADCIMYAGDIDDSVIDMFRFHVERLRSSEIHREALCVILRTDGGNVRTVERLVNITRKNYSEVYFVVPEKAYSAGTVWCMSGDKIFMDYTSVLGPIDPQVYDKKSGMYVPVIGYLEKMKSLTDKSERGELTPAEYMMLKELDVAALYLYEQELEITEELLKRWLVKYKFKDWEKHSSTGDEVSNTDKKNAASRIARELGDNKKWHSHDRPINVLTLEEMGLKIDDYSDDKLFQSILFPYYNCVLEYSVYRGVDIESEIILHSKIGNNRIV
jgi:hypothetical protein